MSIARPDEEVPIDPKEDNALPSDPVNNYYLGNILRTIFEKLYSIPAPEDHLASS
jgi:hypothetical protein